MSDQGSISGVDGRGVVSVVIPVYGVEQWIEGCVESVLQQCDVDFECILVDDCTTDSSIDLVRKLIASNAAYGAMCEAGKVRILSTGVNSGQSVARNVGVDDARGEWVFFLDADDRLLEPCSLSRLYCAAIAAGDEVAWVQGNFLRVSSTDNQRESCSGRKSRTWETSYYNAENPVSVGGREIYENFSKLNFVNAANKLIKRRFIDDHKLTFTAGLIFEDSLWNMQAYVALVSSSGVSSYSLPAVNSRGWAVVTVQGATYYHNIRESSIMTSSFSQRKVESLLYIIEQLQLSHLKVTGGGAVDVNIEATVVTDALYLIKNIYLNRFTGRYRRDVMRSLVRLNVFDCRVNRNGLLPFTRVLSFCFSIKNSFFRRTFIALLARSYRCALWMSSCMAKLKGDR